MIPYPPRYQNVKGTVSGCPFGRVVRIGATYAVSVLPSTTVMIVLTHLENRLFSIELVE